MQACGVSLMRLLRPVALIALLGTAATAYEIIIALPGSNQAFRMIVADVMEERLESTLDAACVLRRLSASRDSTCATCPRAAAGATCFSATRARRVTPRSTSRVRGGSGSTARSKLVQLELVDGTSYRTSIVNQESYEPTEFERLTINFDPSTVFRPDPPPGHAGNDHRAAANQHRGGRVARRPGVQPAVHDPLQVRAAPHLPDPRADRPGARGEQSSWRTSGELRVRVRRHPDQLRPALRRARRGHGRPAAAGSRGLGAEHRHECRRDRT